MKKVLLILLPTVMLFALAACNGETAQPTDSTTAPTSQTEGSVPTEPSGGVTEPDTQPSDPTEGTTAPSEPDVEPSEPVEDPSVPSEPSHEHSYTTAVTAPTCTEDGYTTYTCACGDSYVSDQVAAKGHSYTSKVTAPTCTAEGYTTFTCDCGDSYVGDKLSPKGHSYGAWVTVKEPTTSATGKAERKCSACSAKEELILDKIIEDHTHSYTSSVTKQPTCTSEGVKTYTCSCGSSYTESIAATGHNYTSNVTKQPTCSADGVKTYTCSKCNGSYTESIAKLNHSYSATVVKPTCVEKGYTDHTCSRCSDTYKDNYVNAKGHSYDSGKVTTQPTCTANGVKTYTCGACGNKKTESVNKLGHDYKATVTTPTCTAQGYTTHKCSKCGDAYVDSNTNALGHSFTTKVVAPTCTANGYTKHTCSRCSTSYTDSNQPATGHSYKVTANTATCTKDGTKTETCGNCGNKKNSTAKATGHMNQKTETKSATCLIAGYTKVVCADCGTVISNTTIPAGKHNYQTMRLSDAAKKCRDRWLEYGEYLTYKDWVVEFCEDCCWLDEDTIRFAYTDYEAALIMLGYVNDLRAEVYGTHAYDLQLNPTLIELSKIRAKEISVFFSHFGGSFTAATGENISSGRVNIWDHFYAWSQSQGHYRNMIDITSKYFGYAIYQSDSGAVFGVQLFWEEGSEDEYNEYK